MVEQTFIKGKDACLEDTIERLQARLTEEGFEVEEASWLNPVPNVYSVHIRDRFCPALFTNGKGASRKATLASALGEFFERLETNYFFSDFYLESKLIHPKNDQAWEEQGLYFPNEKAFKLDAYQNCLTPELWKIYDPEQQLCAEDFLSLNDASDEIRCLPLTQASNGQTVYFPMNLFSNLYASNGLSAGNTKEEAMVQGLSEVFERWVKRKILTENLCLPEVPEAVINQFPNVVHARQALREQGIEVSIRDSSLGGRYPVMNVTLFEQKSGRCFASFGAHPIFEVALERTLTESLQGRSLDLLDGFQVPIFDEALVAEDENIENHFIDSSGLIHAKFISQQADFDFVPWDFQGTTQAQLADLIAKVEAEGADVYFAHYQHFGLQACRIVVPGMSEVFPMSELLDNNQNQGRILRELLEALADSDADDRFEQAYEALESLGFADHQGVANLIGLLPDPQSDWKHFKIIDLSMWLLLAMQDYEMAYEKLQVCHYYVDNEAKAHLYRALGFALEILLESAETDYPEAVQACLFGQETVEKVWQCIRGECVLGGIDIGMDAFRNSRNHLALLSVYDRIHQVKMAASW